MRKFVLTLLILVILLAVGWTQRGRILAMMFGRDAPKATPAANVETSPQLAEIAEARLELLREGKVDRVALHEGELQSLLMYRFVQILPAFVDSPRVMVKNGKIEVTARVPVDHLPSIEELGDAAGFLPDTAEVAMRGALLPLDDGRVALSIEQVWAARIPLPQRLVPRALERLGRKDEPGLPKNALALPLPSGIGSARLERDSLILLAQPATRSNQ